MPQRVIMLSSPKGGSGKSSLARNLAVLAAQAGHQVVGVDYSLLDTFKTWAERREQLRAYSSNLREIQVLAGALNNWKVALREARGTGSSVIVVDAPSLLQANMAGVIGPEDDADLILIACQQSHDDVDSVTPWMKYLLADARRAAFVLNSSNPRTRSFSTIRARLLKVGPMCPVDIPLLEEIPFALGQGLGVTELSKPDSAAHFEALWSYTARELGF